MPEGPQVARHARLQARTLVGRPIAVDSPNGRSDDVAALFDGATLRGIEAIGKHLIYDFGDERLLHVHLGRFGNFHTGTMPLPEIRGILRLRMYTDTHWFELRGAIAIEPFDTTRRAALEGRIGPNPLDAAADVDAAYAKIVRSRSAIGTLLMDQSIVGGIGNIYRSEVLFLNGVHPRDPGTTLRREVWHAMWADLARVMADGAKVGRIVTTHAVDRARPRGVARRDDRFYVYHRTGLPCRRCGTAIAEMTLATRRVLYCPHDQPPQSPVPASDAAREPAAVLAVAADENARAKRALATKISQPSGPATDAKPKRRRSPRTS
ncbi:MAG: Fpg/Nei family DNA glycosylase [Vulcanimicrobiaceae bacterium]